MTINDETLLENNYREYPKEASLNKHCERFFQKRFRGENGGTKYFISVFEYLMPEPDYEVELQFEKENYTMNLTLFHIDNYMTVSEMEDEVYEIWKKLDCKWYEEND